MSKARQLADLGNQVDDGAITGTNMVINGAMTVAQRSSSVTGATTNGYYTCDRFKVQIGNIGTYTVDQSTDAPNGFSNSWKISCTTADASPAAGDYLLLNHFIEGQDLQSLGFGTSGAKALTMSFWVKSNKAGNASFEVEQVDNSYIMAGFQYTINAANTWEYKTISIPADATGVINNDNGAGLQINWWLNSGSTFTSGSHNSTWTAFAAGDTNPSNLGIGGSTSDYWQITGVCLNVGDSAIDFPHESYGDTLAKCQRYYQTGIRMGFYIDSNTSTKYAGFSFPEMRALPTATRTGNSISSKEVGTVITFNGNNNGYTQRNSSSSAWAVGGIYALDAEL